MGKQIDQKLRDITYDNIMLDSFLDAIRDEDVWRPRGNHGKQVKQLGIGIVKHIAQNERIHKKILKSIDWKNNGLNKKVVDKVSKHVAKKTGHREEDVGKMIVGGLAVAELIKKTRNLRNNNIQARGYQAIGQAETVDEIEMVEMGVGGEEVALGVEGAEIIEAGEGMALVGEGVGVGEIVGVATEAVVAAGLEPVLLPIAGITALAYGLQSLF